MGMLWLYYGSVFVAMAAVMVGAVCCFDVIPQEQANVQVAHAEVQPMLAGAEQPARSDEGQALPPNVDEKKPVEELVEIPLSSILTTSPQRGLLRTRDAFPQQSGDRNNKVTNGYLWRILTETKGGASNAFLVDATNASDAISASLSVLIGSGGVEIPVPVNKPDPMRGQYWLVVYLGSGPSNPVSWTVEDVVVDQNAVKLRYRTPKPQPATDDIRRYYYWVPLGKLDQETYEIQLFDADKSVVTLMRRVEVTR